MTLEPLHDYLLIEPRDASAEKGGLVHLEARDKKISKAKILAIGDQVDMAIFDVGDEVVYQSWQTDEVDLDDVRHVFIRTEFVLAKVK